MIIFNLVLYFSVANSLYREVDATLSAKVEAVISDLDFQAGQLDFQPENLPVSTADLLIQISDITGKVLVQSTNLRGESLVLGKDLGLETIMMRTEPSVRLLTILAPGENEDPSVLVQVGMSLSRVESSLGLLRLGLMLITPILLALSSLGGFFLADRLLRPIRAMAQAAENIGERSLDQRLPVKELHDELGQLAVTFNRAFERLQHAFENQRRFVSDASHELRTPLTVLRGKLEVTLRRARSREEYHQVVESALAQSERLSNLVENLLWLARTDAGEGSPDLRSVRLDKLCVDLCRELHPVAQRKRISLEAVCTDRIGMLGNPELLHHLVLNLLDNAIKYTPEGGKVQLALCREGQQAKLTVSDTGVGIPEENLPHIFERFYRVDKARSQSVPGTGLGLSIVREIVDNACKGAIEVRSTPGQGTTFTVYLPLDRAGTLPS